MLKIKNTTQLIVKQSDKTLKNNISSYKQNVFDIRHAYSVLPADILDIKKEQLETLINQKLSLNNIAQKLNIKVHHLRILLNHYNLITENQNEYRLIKGYSEASTQKEKDEIMKEIDEYLKSIAKEKSKVEGEPFEDCLQDLRLQFFEIISKSQEKGITYKTAIFNELRKSIQPKEIETVPLSTLKKTNSIPVSEDLNLQQLEADNLEEHLWLYIRNHLNKLDFLILNKHINEYKSLKEISDILQLPLGRVMTLFDRAKERAESHISHFCEKLEGLSIVKK